MSVVTRQEVRDQGFTDPPYSDTRVDDAIAEITDYVEQVTGNWFDVRDLTLKLDGSGVEVQPVPHPIISISSVKIYGDEVSLNDLKIYNRHLQGNVDGDDRQNPRIEFNSDFVENYYSWYGRSRLSGQSFPQGSQNIEIVGKFGYRDFDPLNAEGKCPPLLKRAFFMLMPRFIENAASPFAMAAWRSHEVSRKSTRGQSCENSSAITMGKIFGGLTGDEYIDRILSLYTRPIGVAVV